MLLMDRIRRRLRSNAARLDRLNAAIPARGNRLATYTADRARLFYDAGFTPDPWQAGLLRSADRMNLILCARQVGKSLTVSILALATAFTKPGSTSVIIAPVQPQASELLRKVTNAFYRCGQPIGIIREGATYVEFANRSRIIALPGKERSVHSYTADGALILEEAARIPDEVFAAASPQLSVSNGTMYALSTAFAKSGWFYREWEEGQGYRRWSITAKECPRHSETFLAAERRRLGERWFAMAYLNKFGDDMAAVFRSEDIKRAFTNTIQPLDDFDRDGALSFEPPAPLFAAGVLDSTLTTLEGF